MPKPFDVVTVADFSGTVSDRFETMTLFLLASWLEFGGPSRDLPLHIASIGAAPESVRVMAARCNAEITEHRPMHTGGFVNKLRGYEINRQTGHVLLLDSDVLILSDISPLSDLIKGNCISAAPANGPCIVPVDQWKRVHRMLGLDYPQHHLDPLNLELDTFQCAPYRDRSVGTPRYKGHDYYPAYYNGGVVYSPWEAHLGEIWYQHLLEICEQEPDIRDGRGNVSNQPSLATAVNYLQSRGFHFQLLPSEYHVRWQSIAAGQVPLDQARLYHTIGFGRWSANIKDKTAAQDIDIYLANTLEMTRKLRSHRGPLQRLSHRLKLGLRIRECHRVHALMSMLYEKYVREFKN